MNTKLLKQASAILKATYPKPLIAKTVDEYRNYTATQRQILFVTQNIYPPRLMQTNPR